MPHTIGAVRILHVVPYYADAWAYGGIPRVASAMARGLAARGHDVTVCTTDAADARSRVPLSPAKRDGVNVRIFPNVSNRLAYHWQFFLPVGLRRFLECEAHSFDVGHVHACHNVPGTLAASALVRAGVPYVVSPNGTAPRIERRRAAKWLFDATMGRQLLPGASRVLATTGAEHRQLREAGVERTRLRIVPNPIDLSEFDYVPDARRFRSDHGLDEDGRVVLYLGKLTPRKGVDVLVHALAHLRAPKTQLVIAGNDMGAGPAISRAIQGLGTGARIRRLGLLSGATRLDALAAADVVVYPSRDEIFGLVPLEALLCGRPAIVADDSGCGEVISKVGGGLLVPYGNAMALARAIEEVLGDHTAWMLRARSAAGRIRAAFAADQVCGSLEAVYQEVCA
jgi:glycosyltransferase involved in cell wall biosynthesis